MKEKIAFSLPGVAMIVIGLYHLIQPSVWAMPDDDDDAPRDAFGRLIERPHWKVRLIGLGMVVAGLLWIYMFLFVKPADEPALV